MSARSQVTLRAQGGGVEEDVTVDQSGSPERLYWEDVSSGAQVVMIIIDGYELD